jgi:hypothetical protein
MNARQPRWISVAKASGDERTPVAPLSSKALVAENIRHQLSEAVRNSLNPEPRLAWRGGQAIAGKGWRHDREGTSRISPKPRRIRQPWDQLEKLENGEGLRSSMGSLAPRSGLAYLISAPLGPQRTGQFSDDVILNAEVIDVLIVITRR